MGGRELRAAPSVARMVLRRCAGPLVLWNPTEPDAEFIDYEANLTPALLDGL